MIRQSVPLPLGRITRGVAVGDCPVVVVVKRPVAACQSGAVARLAEEVAEESLRHLAGQVRVASLLPSGRPVALVAGRRGGVSVSTSHTPALIGAAACREADIGIDIVESAPQPAAGERSDVGLEYWFTPGERHLLAEDRSVSRGMVWGAKEAAYKAAALDAEFRPLEVLIEAADAAHFRWNLGHSWRAVRGVGRFFLVAGQIVVLAVAQPERKSRCWTAHEMSGGSGSPCS
jgi:4'-phosphopantetheinyl transferase EntD